MARRLILFSPDCYYHIYNRGNNREPIFLEEENYSFFLKKMCEYFDKARIDIIAYCLMPNHYHLLVYLRRIERFPISNSTKTKKISEICSNNFSNLMRSFNISYAKSFNNWYHRTGHVFQGNFQAREIVEQLYLTNICRYIHLNPVRAGLAPQPDDWRYSDYLEWISNVCTEESVKIKVRNLWFGTGKVYKDFVDDYATEQKMQEEIIRILFGKI